MKNINNFFSVPENKRSYFEKMLETSSNPSKNPMEANGFIYFVFHRRNNLKQMM